MSINKFVYHHCEKNRIPKERVQIVEWKHFNAADVERGVLFVHAPWSAQSASALSMFFQALSQADPGPTFGLFFLDAEDYNPSEFVEMFGSVSQGYGESYWIKDGKLVHKEEGAGRGTNWDSLKQQFTLMAADKR